MNSIKQRVEAARRRQKLHEAIISVIPLETLYTDLVIVLTELAHDCAIQISKEEDEEAEAQ